VVILHLLAPARTGGVERVVQSLAVGQHRAGHRVEVAAVLEEETPDHPLFPPLERAGVPVHRLIVPPRSYRRERQAVASIIRNLTPDVTHSHGYRTDVVDGRRIQRLGTAIVSTAHGFTTGDWKNQLYEHLQRRALRRFDAVIAVSQPLRDQLVGVGIPSSRVYLVPNAWSELVEPLDRTTARAQLGLPPTGFIVGWVGRMSREKGLDVLVEALLRMADLQLTLCAIGDGSERRIVQARARQLDVASRIRWAGLVSEAAKYFRAFDAFVLSSRTEGVPIALLEAMAAEVPVVATRVGGVPAVLGVAYPQLVDPDAPAALEAAIRTIHDDPAGALTRAQAARERLLEKFGPTAWLQRHEEIYRSAVEARREGP